MYSFTLHAMQICNVCDELKSGRRKGIVIKDGKLIINPECSAWNEQNFLSSSKLVREINKLHNVTTIEVRVSPSRSDIVFDTSYNYTKIVDVQMFSNVFRRLNYVKQIVYVPFVDNKNEADEVKLFIKQVITERSKELAAVDPYDNPYTILKPVNEILIPALVVASNGKMLIPVNSIIKKRSDSLDSVGNNDIQCFDTLVNLSSECNNDDKKDVACEVEMRVHPFIGFALIKNKNNNLKCIYSDNILTAFAKKYAVDTIFLMRPLMEESGMILIKNKSRCRSNNSNTISVKELYCFTREINYSLTELLYNGLDDKVQVGRGIGFLLSGIQELLDEIKNTQAHIERVEPDKNSSNDDKLSCILTIGNEHSAGSIRWIMPSFKAKNEIQAVLYSEGPKSDTESTEQYESNIAKPPGQGDETEIDSSSKEGESDQKSIKEDESTYKTRVYQKLLDQIFCIYLFRNIGAITVIIPIHDPPLCVGDLYKVCVLSREVLDFLKKLSSLIPVPIIFNAVNYSPHYLYIEGNPETAKLVRSIGNFYSEYNVDGVHIFVSKFLQIKHFQIQPGEDKFIIYEEPNSVQGSPIRKPLPPPANDYFYEKCVVSLIGLWTLIVLILKIKMLMPVTVK